MITPIEDRLWRRVDKNGSKIGYMDSRCWEWQGYRLKEGYGHIKEGKTMTLTHRLSWRVNFGEIPEAMLVLHRCDNPSCVNPDHLFLGTHQDNMDDRGAKGRQANQGGEKNGRSKLDSISVIEIRNSLLSRKELAKLYLVSKSLIDKIINRNVWTHI